MQSIISSLGRRARTYDVIARSRRPTPRCASIYARSNVRATRQYFESITSACVYMNVYMVHVRIYTCPERFRSIPKTRDDANDALHCTYMVHRARTYMDVYMYKFLVLLLPTVIYFTY